MKITQKHIGKRLLLTDKYTGIPKNEVTLLEISPSRLRGKFENEHCKYWQDLDEVELLEVLADAEKKAINDGNMMDM